MKFHYQHKKAKFALLVVEMMICTITACIGIYFLRGHSSDEGISGISAKGIKTLIQSASGAWGMLNNATITVVLVGLNIIIGASTILLSGYIISLKARNSVDQWNCKIINRAYRDDKEFSKKAEKLFHKTHLSDTKASNKILQEEHVSDCLEDQPLRSTHNTMHSHKKSNKKLLQLAKNREGRKFESRTTDSESEEISPHNKRGKQPRRESLQCSTTKDLELQSTREKRKKQWASNEHLSAYDNEPEEWGMPSSNFQRSLQHCNRWVSQPNLIQISRDLDGSSDSFQEHSQLAQQQISSRCNSRPSFYEYTENWGKNSSEGMLKYNRGRRGSVSCENLTTASNPQPSRDLDRSSDSFQEHSQLAQQQISSRCNSRPSFYEYTENWGKNSSEGMPKYNRGRRGSVSCENLTTASNSQPSRALDRSSDSFQEHSQLANQHTRRRNNSRPLFYLDTENKRKNSSEGMLKYNRGRRGSVSCENLTTASNPQPSRDLDRSSDSFQEHSQLAQQQISSRCNSRPSFYEYTENWGKNSSEGMPKYNRGRRGSVSCENLTTASNSQPSRALDRSSDSFQEHSQLANQHTRRRNNSRPLFYLDTENKRKNSSEGMLKYNRGRRGSVSCENLTTASNPQPSRDLDRSSDSFQEHSQLAQQQISSRCNSRPSFYEYTENWGKNSSEGMPKYNRGRRGSVSCENLTTASNSQPSRALDRSSDSFQEHSQLANQHTRRRNNSRPLFYLDTENKRENSSEGMPLYPLNRRGSQSCNDLNLTGNDLDRLTQAFNARISSDHTDSDASSDSSQEYLPLAQQQTRSRKQSQSCGNLTRAFYRNEKKNHRHCSQLLSKPNRAWSYDNLIDMEAEETDEWMDIKEPISTQMQRNERRVSAVTSDAVEHTDPDVYEENLERYLECSKSQALNSEDLHESIARFNNLNQWGARNKRSTSNNSPSASDTDGASDNEPGNFKHCSPQPSSQRGMQRLNTRRESLSSLNLSPKSNAFQNTRRYSISTSTKDEVSTINRLHNKRRALNNTINIPETLDECDGRKKPQNTQILSRMLDVAQENGGTGAFLEEAKSMVSKAQKNEIGYLGLIKEFIAILSNLVGESMKYINFQITLPAKCNRKAPMIQARIKCAKRTTVVGSVFNGIFAIVAITCLIGLLSSVAFFASIKMNFTFFYSAEIQQAFTASTFAIDTSKVESIAIAIIICFTALLLGAIFAVSETNRHMEYRVSEESLQIGIQQALKEEMEDAIEDSSVSSESSYAVAHASESGGSSPTPTPTTATRTLRPSASGASCKDKGLEDPKTPSHIINAGKNNLQSAIVVIELCHQNRESSA